MTLSSTPEKAPGGGDLIVEAMETPKTSVVRDDLDESSAGYTHVTRKLYPDWRLCMLGG